MKQQAGAVADRPARQPRTREANSKARMDEMFRPDTASDLHLPTRQEMQASRI